MAVTCQFNPTQGRIAAGLGGCRMPVPSISTNAFCQGFDLPDLKNSVEFARGGFWRRALAVFIDLIAVGVVLQLIGLVLFPLSNGRLQFSGGPLDAISCQKLEAVPEGVSIPAEFGANSINDCRQSLLGL